MKNPKTPTTPASLGEIVNIIVTMSRKAIKLSNIIALSISDIIAQGLCSALRTETKLVTVRSRSEANKIQFLSPQDVYPKS